PTAPPSPSLHDALPICTRRGSGRAPARTDARGDRAMTILHRLGLALAATLCLALPARAELNIQEVTSPGGITAWLVEDHGIPFVDRKSTRLNSSHVKIS